MVVGLSDGTTFKDSEEWLATAVTAPVPKDIPRVVIGPEPSETTPSTASRMPLGSPTEPAGALKQAGGTQTPGNDSVQEIHPEPYGLNPPEGNAIQGYVKGMEQAIKDLPDTIRNIPQKFSEDMEKSKSKTDAERLGEAMDIAMSFGTGTIAGVRSAAIKGKLSELGHAQVLESNNVHPDEIWNKTGFGRGVDGRWRYEINDSASKFDPRWNTEATTPLASKLSSILDHPELYQAYPLLKDVKVIRDPRYAPRGAAYGAGSGPGKLQGAQIRMGVEAAENQGTLMHEVQHAIQGYEGFAKGGSPRSDARYLKYTPDLDALRPEMEAIVEKQKDPKAIWTTEEIKRVRYLGDVSRKYKEYTEAAYSKAYEFYERLAGEVESRNVDTRLLLTEAERRKMPLNWTEDLPRSKQIPRDVATSTTAYGLVDKGHYVKP